MNTLKNDIAVAVYDWHSAAERAVRSCSVPDATCNASRWSARTMQPRSALGFSIPAIERECAGS